eukprot:3072646-Pyramimonas_sp.AAC.1
MKEAHPTLSGEVFIEKLRAVALMQYTDTSGIEARHAGVRRHLATRSAQTHALDVRDASSEHVFQQMRTTRLSCRHSSARKRVHKKKTQTAGGVGSV